MPRLQWTDLEEQVGSWIEAELGAAVIESIGAAGGFSPGIAADCRLADGRSCFVKAVSPDQNLESPNMARHEASVAAALPSGFPAPRLLRFLDDGHWVVLIYELLQAECPEVPWRPDQLELVLNAMNRLVDITDPSPVNDLRLATDLLAEDFTGWRRLEAAGVADGQHPIGDLEPWVIESLPLLAEMEQPWVEAAEGSALVHLDLRSDNLMIDGDERVWFVDWAHGAIGAPWLDLVFLLPSVAMEGGPEPEDLWQRSPYSSTVDPEAVTAVIAGVAGYFTFGARQPSPTGLPTLRAFQEAQGVVARRWLERRIG